MPWCDECSKFWSPNSLPADGRCPSCGRELEATRPAAVAAAEEGRSGEAEPRPKVPWHFTLLVVAVALYLGWRLWQLVAWLVG